MEGGSGEAQGSKPLARLRRALTYGNIWLAALAVMKRKRAYAYALPGEIRERFGFEPSKLMTYFVLYKLEAEGLIASSFEGRRKYYKLTGKGLAALEAAKRLLRAMAEEI